MYSNYFNFIYLSKLLIFYYKFKLFDLRRYHCHENNNLQQKKVLI